MGPNLLPLLIDELNKGKSSIDRPKEAETQSAPPKKRDPMPRPTFLSDFIEKIIKDQDQFEWMVESGGLDWRFEIDRFFIPNPTVKQELLREAIYRNKTDLLEAIIGWMNPSEIVEICGSYPRGVQNETGQALLKKMSPVDLRKLFLVYLLPLDRSSLSVLPEETVSQVFSDTELLGIKEGRWPPSLLTDQFIGRITTPGREAESLAALTKFDTRKNLDVNRIIRELEKIPPSKIRSEIACLLLLLSPTLDPTSYETKTYYLEHDNNAVFMLLLNTTYTRLIDFHIKHRNKNRLKLFFRNFSALIGSRIGVAHWISGKGSIPREIKQEFLKELGFERPPSELDF